MAALAPASIQVFLYCFHFHFCLNINYGKAQMLPDTDVSLRAAHGVLFLLRLPIQVHSGSPICNKRFTVLFCILSLSFFCASSEVYENLGCSSIWSVNHGMCLPRHCQQFQADLSHFAELPVLWWTRTFKSTIPFYNMKALVKDRATGNVCISHFTWHVKYMKIYFLMSCYSLYYS